MSTRLDRVLMRIHCRIVVWGWAPRMQITKCAIELVNSPMAVLISHSSIATKGKCWGGGCVYWEDTLPFTLLKGASKKGSRHVPDLSPFTDTCGHGL